MTVRGFTVTARGRAKRPAGCPSRSTRQSLRASVHVRARGRSSCRHLQEDLRITVANKLLRFLRRDTDDGLLTAAGAACAFCSFEPAALHQLGEAAVGRVDPRQLANL